jgi:antirestriction protein ArdC
MPGLDAITMPQRKFFKSEAGFYGTLFHEAAHWTGHKSRLDRDLTGSFGSQSYSREELIAEMSSAFVSGALGIDGPERTIDHAAYMQSWLRALENDPSMIVWAAGRAQKAADMILNRPAAAEVEKESE